jgi:hypothetical protein
VPLTVREVDLAVEMPQLVDVFNRGFNAEIPRERFEWLYRRNPDGPATAWFVVDDRNGEIAGCTAVFPRRIQVRRQARPSLAWNCGDFCIMPRYRAGAAAIKLRQAAKEGVDAGASPFLYAHPNERMLQIHLRVGHQPLGKMIRLARPTAVRGSGVVNRLGTLALRAARHDRLWRGGDECEVVSGSLAADVDDLFERMRRCVGTALVRDGRYLSWRFGECPVGDYRFILARRGGRVSGYLAYGLAGGQLNVKDWLGLDARAVRALFSAAVDEACRADASSASVTLLETHRDLPVIRRTGFLPRPEVSTAITYAAESLAWRADVMSADAWYMTVGDRDV